MLSSRLCCTAPRGRLHRRGIGVATGYRRILALHQRCTGRKPHTPTISSQRPFQRTLHGPAIAPVRDVIVVPKPPRIAVVVHRLRARQWQRVPGAATGAKAKGQDMSEGQSTRMPSVSFVHSATRLLHIIKCLGGRHCLLVVCRIGLEEAVGRSVWRGLCTGAQAEGISMREAISHVCVVPCTGFVHPTAAASGGGCAEQRLSVGAG